MIALQLRFGQRVVARRFLMDVIIDTDFGEAGVAFGTFIRAVSIEVFADLIRSVLEEPGNRALKRRSQHSL